MNKTGTILLVSTQSAQGEAIQKFQCKADVTAIAIAAAWWLKRNIDEINRDIEQAFRDADMKEME